MKSLVLYISDMKFMHAFCKIVKISVKFENDTILGKRALWKVLYVSSIKYLTGEKSIPCWQRTITIFTFEKSFSVNGKYDINLLWKFKGKRKIIGQNLFLPKNHISTARLGKSLNHLMDMRLSRLIESSLNKILEIKIERSHNKSINLKVR